MTDMLETDRRELDDAIGAMHDRNFLVALPTLERLEKAYPERRNLAKWRVICQEQLNSPLKVESLTSDIHKIDNLEGLPTDQANLGRVQIGGTSPLLPAQSPYPPNQGNPDFSYNYQIPGNVPLYYQQPENARNYTLYHPSQRGLWQDFNNETGQPFQSYYDPSSNANKPPATGYNTPPGNFYPPVGVPPPKPGYYWQVSYPTQRATRSIENLSLLQLLIGLAGCCFIIAGFLPQALVRDSFQCHGAFEMGNSFQSAPCGPWISRNGSFYTQNSIIPFDRTSIIGGLSDAIAIVTILAGLGIMVGAVLTTFKVKLKVDRSRIDSIWLSIVGTLVASLVTLYRFLNLPKNYNPVQWDYPKHGFDGSVIGQGYNSGTYETTSSPQLGLLLAGVTALFTLLILLMVWRIRQNHRKD